MNVCEDGRTYVQIASWPPAVTRHGWRGWAWCVAAGLHETCTSRVILSLVALEPDHGFTVRASVVEAWQAPRLSGLCDGEIIPYPPGSSRLARPQILL
jgi:hypothetical protein